MIASNLNFVFVTGRKINDLSQIVLDLFNGITNKRVSLLNRDDTVKLIRLSEQNKTLNWQNKAIYKSAQDELTRITNEFKKQQDDFPKLKPTIEKNETTLVWHIKIDDSSYSRESAEMLRLWATQKLEVQGAYILRRVKKTY